LFGYRYGAYSVGENIAFSPRIAVSLSAFGNRLESPERGSESQEAGLSFGVSFAWTERTNMQATYGRSRRDIAGARSLGTTGTFALTHQDETRDFSLELSHSLVPFGTGVLTERNNAEFAIAENLNSRWRGVGRAGYSSNKDAGFGFIFDSRTFRYVNAELRWQVVETWFTSLVAGYASASDIGAAESIGGWSLALRTGWTPAKRVFGH
jgi:hypothetical protein